MADGLTERERDRARTLILRGRAKPPKGESAEEATARDGREREERQLIDRFFRGLKAFDLVRCIGQFEVAEKVEHRRECAHLLIAYFIWCKNCNCGAVPIDERGLGYSIEMGGVKIDPWERDPPDVDHYILEFVKVGFERMTDLSIDPSERFDLPQWQTPNAGFGWDLPAHRPKRDNLHRDIGIVAFIELHRRQGKTPRAAARLVCKQFSDDPYKPMSLSVVEKIVRGLGECLIDVGCLDDWYPLPDSDEELCRSRDAALKEITDRRKGKKS
jgi:hypothetical protein